jgi:hypothetical protein
MKHLPAHLEAIRKGLVFFLNRFLMFFSVLEASTKIGPNQIDFLPRIERLFYCAFLFFFSNQHRQKCRFLWPFFLIRNDAKIFFLKNAYYSFIIIKLSIY